MTKGRRCYPKGTPFMEQIQFEPMSGCWIWDAAWTRAGYGVTSINGKRIYAHRYSYEIHKGPIPEGLTIDHLCRNTACCNPDHLEAVTMKVNSLRSEAPPAKNARKTHCPKGHPLDADNTIIKKGTGWRECKLCSQERNRKAYHRNPGPYIKRAKEQKDRMRAMKNGDAQ